MEALLFGRQEGRQALPVTDQTGRRLAIIPLPSHARAWVSALSSDVLAFQAGARVSAVLEALKPYGPARSDVVADSAQRDPHPCASNIHAHTACACQATSRAA